MMRIKYDSDLQRGKSSDYKPKMVGLYRKIGHKSVMSIHYFFMDIYDLTHLLDQAIHGMEGIGESSSKGDTLSHSIFPGEFYQLSSI